MVPPFRSYCEHCLVMRDFTEGQSGPHEITSYMKGEKGGLILEARQVRSTCNHCGTDKRVVRSA